MGDKVYESRNYQIHENSIGWFTVFKMHNGGERATRCGSYETLEQAREDVITRGML